MIPLDTVEGCMWIKGIVHPKKKILPVYSPSCRTKPAWLPLFCEAQKIKRSFENCLRVKGIVHPKLKILSSFTHPQVVPNLYECLCSAEHKGRYSEEWGKQSSSGAPLTSIVFFFYYGSQWCPKTAWLQTFFKISSVVFGRTKTFIQVWNYLRVSKWWQNFHLDEFILLCCCVWVTQLSCVIAIWYNLIININYLCKYLST